MFLNEFIDWFKDVFNEMSTFFDSWGWKIVEGAITIILGLILVKILKRIAKKLLLRGKLDRTVASFLLSIVTAVLYVMLIYIIASTFGVPMDSFLALIASCGVALGLALQNSLSNIANGILLIVNKPFKASDYVSINGIEGTVRTIKLTTTELVTPDNKIVNVPNSSVIGANIINYNGLDTRRLDLVFSVSYDADIEVVKATLLELANKHDLVFKDPAPFCRLQTQNSSSLDFALRVWLNSGDYWTVKFDLNEEVLLAFKEKNINIPYNQIDVNVNSKNN